VRLSTPARAAPVWAMPGKPRATLAMTLMIFPRRCGIIARLATALVTLKVPRRLLRTTASKPFGEMSFAGDGNCPPALLTSTSMRPKRSTTDFTKASMASGWRMSTEPAMAWWPFAARASAARVTGSTRRPQRATAAPREVSSAAMARPMPVPPPVTSATRPAKSPGRNGESSRVMAARIERAFAGTVKADDRAQEPRGSADFRSTLPVCATTLPSGPDLTAL
jgi:hypothetical protein